MKHPTYSLSSLINHHARVRPGQLAYSTPHHSITFSDLATRTYRLAAHLYNHVGTKPIAIILPRCIEFVETILAVTRASCIGVPLDPRASTSEIRWALRDCGAHVIFTNAAGLDKVCAALEDVAGVVIVAVDASEDDIAKCQAVDIVRYEDWALGEVFNGTNEQGNRLDSLGLDEPAWLHYTSGTTGIPKGVVSSQRAWLVSATHYAEALGITSADTLIWPLPLFHAFGHSLCIVGSVVVGTSVYLTGHSQGVLASVLACDKVTIIAGVPSTYQDMAMELALAEKDRKEIRLPRPRLCIAAGGTTPTRVKRHTKAIFGVSLLNNYGSTEACGPIAVTGPPRLNTEFDEIFDLPLLNRYGCTESCGAIVAETPGDTCRDNSCGTPLPHLEIQIAKVDTKSETCEPVVDGIEGEIWIRGPSMMLQYWGCKPQQEAPFTYEGWYRTGDLGRRLPGSGGHITVTGRLNELIRRGSETIHPAEVERVLRSCSGVEEVVVSGLPHDIFGEIVAAFIVRAPQHTEIDPVQLLSACRAVLPDFKVPTIFFEIESLPRTRAGKLRRRSVLERRGRPLHARLDLKHETMLALVLGELRGACELGSEESLDVNLPFVDLGMNSLAGVVLCDRLASLTGLERLPVTLIYDYPTPAAVSDCLCRQLLDRASDPRKNVPHLQRLSTDTSSSDDHTADPIAIISMACRYPGSISSPGDLWDVVISDTDATSDFPTDRGWDLDSLASFDGSDSRPGACVTSRGGFLADMADFDIAPFHISPREALATDPQQRLLLETTWQLVERARLAPSALRGSDTGVFAGLMYSDYAGRFLNDDAHGLDSHLGLGSAGSVAAGRISYTFGLNGPSMAIDTACSSSLVAIDLAMKSLRSGECSLAIAGGVAVMATPRPFVMFSRQGGLAPDGRCKSYSASADGTAWSEGVGLLMLERLSNAQKNGRQILGLIRGSAVNSDGASNGLTAPSAAAQECVIWQALANAGVGPDEVDVVEGHGTATKLGDAIETQAVATVYGQHQREFPLLLGSIKSNIGHTQAAAGVAGIIKMVEAMKHGTVPSSLHVDKPSPYIATGGRVALAIEKVPWPRRSQGGPRRAAVSSFGIGGTNSHFILEEYVEDWPHCATTSRPQPSEDITQRTYPWLLSGAEEMAMRAQAKALLQHRQEEGTMTDTAFSLATTRSALTHRAAILSRGGRIDSALRSLAQNQQDPDIVSGVVPGKSPQLIFMFPGQASLKEHSISDIKSLCTCFPAFDDAFHEICQELDSQLAFPLSRAMSQEFEELIRHTDLYQAVIFALEVALFRLLESFGIHPDAVVGHSVGEIAAAHCAGHISLESAAILIAIRGKLMASLPSGRGAMASISASEEDVKNALIDLTDNEAVCSIAAVNARESVVVSGTVETVSTVMEIFASRGDVVSLLKGVKHAFHSSCMDSVSERLIEALSRDSTSLSPAEDSKKITMVSTVSGQVVDTSQLMAPAYWADQLRATVRFAEAVEELAAKGSPVFLELGPSAPLSTHVPNSIATHASIDTVFEALARLWVCGMQMQWDVIYECSGARAIDLPTYQFQKRRYWLDPPKRPTAIPYDYSMNNRGMVLNHPILREIAPVPGVSDTMACHGYLSLDTLPWLADHVVGSQPIVPATVLADLAFSAGRACFQTRPTLEELVITEPLILMSVDCVKIQVVVKGDSASAADGCDLPHSVDVYSRPLNANLGRAWAHHVTCIIKRFGALSSSVKPEPVTTWQEVDMDIEGAYAALSDAADMKYGPMFKCVRAIWRSQDGLFLRARLQLSNGTSFPTSTSTFAIHPALLDAALHVRALLSAAGKSTVGLLPRLPFVLRGLQIFQNHRDQGSIFVRIPSCNSAGAEGIFSVLLEDQAGDPIAIIAEVITRPWKSNPPAADLFSLEWAPLRAIGTTESVPMSKASQHALDTVVQTWDIINRHHGLSLPDKVHAATAQVLNTIQQWSLEEKFAAGGRLIVVTEKASISNPDLMSAAIWGLIRSAQAEFELGRLVLIDLDGKADSLRALPRALASQHGLVAVRNGELKIPRLSKCETVSAQNSPITTPPLLNTSGAVLVTGGTGALGALLARHLILEYKAQRLVLLSRSGLDAPEATTILADLSSLGAAVDILACDVSDRDQLAAMFAKIQPPVTAIIHTAGVLDDSVLSTQTAQRISKVLQPKVNGAWILHEVAPPEAQLYFFSSAAGVFGNPGQAGYAAANCFLDALARWRRTRGLHGLSLAWGPWENRRGMAGGTTRDGMLMALSDEQALAAFDTAVRLNKEEALLIPLLLRGSSVDHLPLLATKQGPSLTLSPNKSNGHSLWKELLAVTKSPKDRAIALHDLIQNEVALVLGYRPQDTLPNRPFTELGMDSFTAVQLRNRISVLSGLKGLPATIAFDTKSLPALVGDLLARLDEDAGNKGTAQVVSARAPNTDEPTLSQQVQPPASTHARAQGNILLGLASLFNSLYQAGQVNAAAKVLAAASLALPRFTSSILPVRQTPCHLSTGSDTKPTVLVIPDFSPTVAKGGSRYTHLAAAMGSDYDIYELPHPTDLVPDSLDALAEAHATTVCEMFSKKAVVLVGFSAGGCVAHAVAHRLLSHEAGLVVGLALLDTYTLVSKDNVPDWLMRLALPAAGIAVGTNPDPEEDAHLATMGAYLNIVAGWRPKPLPRRLRTLFLRATEPVAGSDQDWCPAEWPLADEVVKVPGHHLAMLERRNAVAVAAAIRSWIVAETTDDPAIVQQLGEN